MKADLITDTAMLNLRVSCVWMLVFDTPANFQCIAGFPAPDSIPCYGQRDCYTKLEINPYLQIHIYIRRYEKRPLD